MNYLVSIIIPVHNTSEQDFQSCYQSVSSQSYSNVEIVIVNDRSNNACLNMIRRIIYGNKNAVLLNSEGTGVACARNTGVKHSHGVYLMFMDSDDILNPKAVSEAVKLLEIHCLDMVIGKHKRCSKEEFEFPDSNFGIYSMNVEVINTNDQDKIWQYFFRYDKIYPDSGEWKMSPYSSCVRLLKRSACDDVFFPEGVEIGEDLIWNYRFLKRRSIFVGLADCNWYLYIQHPKSVMHTFSSDYPKKLTAYIKCLNQEFSVCNGRIYDYYITRIFYAEFCGILKNYFYNLKDVNSLEKYMQFYKMCNSEPFNQIRFRDIASIKVKLKYLLFRSGLAYPWYAVKTMLGMD